MERTDSEVRIDNHPATYAVQYQQQDVAVQDILVPEVWINGGKGEDGVDYPGCWDNHRGICDIPRGLSQPWYSIVSADPSATNYWAIGWWLYHPASEQRFLLDLHNERMDASDLLDWNANDEVFYGLLEDWANRAKSLGAPLRHLIVEANACQRWLLQYDHTKRWMRKHNILVIPHQTSAANKL